MRKLFGFPDQGRLHPVDLQLIEAVVKKALGDVMAQIDDLLSGLAQLTTDVSNAMAAHAAEIADLQSQLQATQDAAANNQPVDLTDAIAAVNTLRADFETTANTAAQASDVASQASDQSTNSVTGQ